MKKWHTGFVLLKEHWPIVAIVVLATWLRTWQLTENSIFFGDAAHDLWSAKQAVEHRELPLLGIASSVPRFKQGPLTVWIEMVVYAGFGPQLLPFSLVFAAISLAAVVGVYELCVTQLNKQTAYAASLWLAVSPLAVAHGRVPYHITPLPLVMVIFLYLAVRAWQRRGKWRWWWLSLSWAIVFQFELATAPLLLVMLYIWWRREWQTHRVAARRQLPQTLVQLMAGVVVGLWPQLWYDLTHRLAQLGGFAAWVLYRTAGSVGVGSTAHSFSWHKITTFLTNTGTYSLRMVSVDELWLGVLWLMFGIWSGWHAWQLAQRQKLPELMEIVLVASASLWLAFLMHGSPSEAHFPPFLTLLAIWLGWGVTQVPRRFRFMSWLGLLGWSAYTVIMITRAQFFVSLPQQSFSYGAGNGEIKAGIQMLLDAGYSRVVLRTTGPGSMYPSHFQNWTWLAQNTDLRISAERNAAFPEPVVFVEPLDSQLSTYPNATRLILDTVQLVIIPDL